MKDEKLTNREAIEEIRESFPEFSGISPFAFIVEAINSAQIE